MTAGDAPDLTVLHTLRCIGFASQERLASVTGLREDDVAARLSTLVDLGLVEHLDGPFGGFGITGSGREKDRELVGSQLEVSGSRSEVRSCYERLLSLNQAVLDVCHEWQMRRIGDQDVLNDHRDTDYDLAVLSRLDRLDREAQQMCVALSGRLERFGSYGPRLSAALDRAMAGDITSVADTLDSYHSVWFQLHEDLLVTLDISREEERRRGQDP